MRSMTGFGHAEKPLDEMDVAVDIRTINSRYFDFKPHLPKEMLGLEPDLRAEVQREIKRGRIDLFLEIKSQRGERLDLDVSVVQNYLALAERLREAGVLGELCMSDLLNFTGVVAARVDDLVSEGVREAIINVVAEAARRAVQARDEEGSLLKADLDRRISKLSRYSEEIAGNAGEVSCHYRDKLTKRLAELVPERDFDEKRLSQEVLYYAERSDISEEVTRLSSHVERFRRYLGQSQRKPVGKSLDFVCQEMNREINTILAKSNLVRVSDIALEAKAEIERIREQVQNVE